MSKGKVDCVIGTSFGDEAKAKILDYISHKYDAVARFGGGNNAGHTVYKNGQKIVLHLIPVGILRDNMINIIGNGVVINPIAFKEEVQKLEALGISVKNNLYISDKAHIITPLHLVSDSQNESKLGENKIGSTLRGIGPCYTDKVSRTGIRVCDLLRTDFKEYFLSKNNTDKDLSEFFEACQFLASFNITRTEYLINNLLDEGKNVIAEGAQAFGLDIDFGTYPYVTSSQTTTAGVCGGLGVSPKRIGTVFGISKCYSTRVGNGPFVTELLDETGEEICKRGNEYGSTTGRKRRCGWLDLDLLKYSIMICGIDKLVLTKCDVLTGFDTVKIYSHGRYYDFPGWKTTNSNEFETFVQFIETVLSIKVSLVSVGVNREDILVREYANQ